VICYSCSELNGQDCFSGWCKGLYCTFTQQRQQNGQMRLTKGCSDVPQLPFDDGTSLTQLNVCKTKYTTTSSYTAEICNTNYCNGYCTSGDDPKRSNK
ncbi:hypothetical protein PFISCL1PPCAC_6999, partial [Pristionchus fissidentatus]